MKYLKPGCICLQEGFTIPSCPDYLVSKGIHTMATAKFTPGPWHSMGSTTIEAADEETICLLSAMYRTKKELKANALLIAAAPDLLSELHKALGCIISPQSFDVDGVIRDLQDVIRKAEGTS